MYCSLLSSLTAMAKTAPPLAARAAIEASRAAVIAVHAAVGLTWGHDRAAARALRAAEALARTAVALLVAPPPAEVPNAAPRRRRRQRKKHQQGMEGVQEEPQVVSQALASPADPSAGGSDEKEVEHPSAMDSAGSGGPFADVDGYMEGAELPNAGNVALAPEQRLEAMKAYLQAQPIDMLRTLAATSGLPTHGMKRALIARIAGKVKQSFFEGTGG